MLSWWQRLPSPNITQPSARRSTGGPGFVSPRFRISVREVHADMLEASNTPARAQSYAISPNPPADYPPGEDTQPTSPDVEELDEQLRAPMARGCSFAHPRPPGGDIEAIGGAPPHPAGRPILHMLADGNAH